MQVHVSRLFGDLKDHVEAMLAKLVYECSDAAATCIAGGRPSVRHTIVDIVYADEAAWIGLLNKRPDVFGRHAGVGKVCNRRQVRGAQREAPADRVCGGIEAGLVVVDGVLTPLAVSNAPGDAVRGFLGEERELTVCAPCRGMPLSRRVDLWRATVAIAGIRDSPST